MSNLQRIRKEPEHVFFACFRFNAYRCELEAMLEQSINPETLVEVMLSSNEAWKAMTTFATKVTQDLRHKKQRRNKLKKQVVGYFWRTNY